MFVSYIVCGICYRRSTSQPTDTEAMATSYFSMHVLHSCQELDIYVTSFFVVNKFSLLISVPCIFMWSRMLTQCHHSGLVWSRMLTQCDHSGLVVTHADSVPPFGTRGHACWLSATIRDSCGHACYTQCHHSRLVVTHADSVPRFGTRGHACWISATIWDSWSTMLTQCHQLGLTNSDRNLHEQRNSYLYQNYICNVCHH